MPLPLKKERLKSALKLLRKKRFPETNVTNEIESHVDNELIENFITEKEIKRYKYSNFEIKPTRRRNIILADFEDKTFALRSFNNDETTLRNVIKEVHKYPKFQLINTVIDLSLILYIYKHS